MWTIHIPKRVDKELSGVPSHLAHDVHHALNELPIDPYPSGCKKLKGRLQCWRVRIGSYRILYDVDSKSRAIVVLKIGPRKDVYR